MVNYKVNEWNRMEMNEFNFVVVWIDNDEKEWSANKFCLDRRRK